MNTEETPRTDAFFNRTDITWDDEVKFAQDLEIELNQLKKLLSEANIQRVNMYGEVIPQYPFDTSF
jgi:hypothetical protein